MAGIRFDQANLVVHNMEATLAFYRRLGVEIDEASVWRTESGAHHVSLPDAGGGHLELDSRALSKRTNAGFAAERGRIVLTFRVETREAVDQLYNMMIAEDHQGLQVPYDAFWGSRYAMIEDPDGNPVALSSPVDRSKSSKPPEV
jgi:catechol 2,3-dioxygenase-like lactoylglutathione lyase family enzyme